MNNFGIFINPFSKEVNEVFDLLGKLYKKNKISFFKLTENEISFPEFITEYKSSKETKLDCILSFGGDGTFLRAVEFSLKYNSPLLGINLGKLGFLSESSLRELEKSIEDLKRTGSNYRQDYY